MKHFNSMGLLPVMLSVVGVTGLQAADEHPDGWRHEARVGLQISSVVVDNNDESRDATIQGSQTNISYLGSFDGNLIYQQQKHSVEQRLELRYGRVRQEGSSWDENNDQLSYDGDYRYKFNKPQYGYVGWGLDTVFTGIEPDEEPLDPATVNASAGYGQKREHTGDKPWLFDWQAGLRVQRTYGRGLGSDGREAQVGIEFQVRYESKPKDDFDWWAQYELFVPGDDAGNHQHLLTAQANYQLTSVLQLSVALRAYYEGESEDAADGAVGYDELSLRQETLLGLAYSF